MMQVRIEITRTERGRTDVAISAPDVAQPWLLPRMLCLQTGMWTQMWTGMEMGAGKGDRTASGLQEDTALRKKKYLVFGFSKIFSLFLGVKRFVQINTPPSCTSSLVTVF